MTHYNIYDKLSVLYTSESVSDLLKFVQLTNYYLNNV